MSDLIERDNTIKEIDGHLAFILQTYNKRYGNSDNEYIAGYKKAHEHIKEVITLKLPSAQPEPQWIPCSERLPKPFEFCLWTTTDGRVVYHHCDGMFSKYTAWMPLPEPWRGEEE